MPQARADIYQALMQADREDIAWHELGNLLAEGHRLPRARPRRSRLA